MHMLTHDNVGVGLWTYILYILQLHGAEQVIKLADFDSAKTQSSSRNLGYCYYFTNIGKISRE